MKDIVEFVKKICAKHNLRAIFVPDINGLNDFFSITTPQGHVVMNFTTRVFYDIPPRLREHNFYPAIKRGLNHLVGEQSVKKNQQTIIRRKYGKQIV